jgi:hypothetical protein
MSRAKPARQTIDTRRHTSNVEDCFLRNNDDEVCVKTISSPPAMESKNIVVRRCVIWNDRARGLGITSETRANISNALFKDCDIIHDFSGGGDCAALAVLVSDSGTMTDIRFEDIQVEDCRNTLVNCWIGADMWGHDKTRGHIKGVTFKDIVVTGRTVPVMKLTGFDAAHMIEDVRIENLQIQKNRIRNAEMAKLQTNAYVRGLAFVASPGGIQESANQVPEDTDSVFCFAIHLPDSLSRSLESGHVSSHTSSMQRRKVV